MSINYNETRLMSRLILAHRSNKRSSELSRSVVS